MKLDLSDIVHVQMTCLTIRESRRRTTVPGEIIKLFSLKNGDRIRWTLLKDGTVIVTPVIEAELQNKKSE